MTVLGMHDTKKELMEDVLEDVEEQEIVARANDGEIWVAKVEILSFVTSPVTKKFFVEIK